MKKIILLSGAAAFALSLSTALAEQRSVNVYNWSDYVDAQVLEDFENETGIEVNYDTFDSNELLETKLLTGNTGYDVVVPSATFLQRQIQAGVYQRLDKSKLPNLKHMDPLLQERTELFDPGNEFSVNYMWGTSGYGVNEDKVLALNPNAPIGSWDLLFNVDELSKIAKCGVYVMDEPDEMFPAAMHYLGLDPDSNRPQDIQKASELLESIRPYIRKFHNSEFVTGLANGDICLAFGWSGDVLQAAERADEADKGVQVTYTLPKEGAQMWFDQLAIPADAENVEEAHEFINYLMRPEVIAKMSDYVYYANGNKDATGLIDETVATNPNIYPTEEVKQRLYTIGAKPLKAQRLMNRAFTQVKTGH
ncbi:Putrescine-binding periplasmic protein precursor [Pseudovibrio axinellae]|uniref:Putrescine-binding periplasmic protein n=1 Tax=Pseudovibrio axinellae TaxID=989403 RepID=A0A165U273_9HYPH|nr:polyamine ABC transporter substrate-binding protein [Pseudovibrio axinellae]KZL09476.1 Putrescine-binding periplasmic protein precursor [Pseudovibrio axinellae]SEQ63674.1 putrescine transport system substrate-binding protein [Pseudovibrio axinellae]